MDSKIASRKLGYGFSSEYQEIPLSEFVVNAKTELETVPKFDPWKLISVERKKKKLFDRQTKEEAIKEEKSFSKKKKKLIQTSSNQLDFINLQLMVTLGKVLDQQ